MLTDAGCADGHMRVQGAAEVLEGVKPGSEGSAQQRRLLQFAQSGSTVLCNAKCQSQVRLATFEPVLAAACPKTSSGKSQPCCVQQVKLYEAFILAALLLSSLFTGLLCMHALGVPDRFEKPKDTGSSRQE